MEGKAIDVFTSKEYRLLYWMEQHQTDTALGLVVKFSQAELAEEYGSSPATVNKWLASLCKAKCVEPYKKRGNYRVTDIGHSVIEQIEEIKNIIGGEKDG